MRVTDSRWLVMLVIVVCGCSRSHYRLRADADAYAAIDQKSSYTPWMPPCEYTIQPHPASRLYFHSPLDDPALPLPAPQLYAYDLPDLPPRDPNRFYRPQSNAAGMLGTRLPDVFVNRHPSTGLRRLPDTSRAGSHQLISNHGGTSSRVVRADFRLIQGEATATRPASPPSAPQPDDSGAFEIRISPIPLEAWDVIPPECRRRMFDFDSLNEEAALTREQYGRDVTVQEADEVRRVALEDILDLALLNSREYQTQKEALYRVALRLSLERFDYQLKFSPTGHRTAVDFSHNRFGGTTINSLSVPTTFSAEKVLLTGGDLLARFANNVLLTFNGPQGFAANVGSDLLLDLGQPIFQRDIGFEALTQAERNVLYAARDFARFRKQFFVDLAAQYYDLIRTFRQVEIDSQNYFSLVRAFNQSEAEYLFGQVSRVQVDQVEQQMLNGRRGLISTCNGLEQALDNLKIQIGLPTELPLNVDLTELQQLTKRDQLAVTGDLIDRVRRRLARERQVSAADQEPDRVVLLSAAVVLIDRTLEASELRTELGLVPFDVSELRLLRAQMLVELSRLTGREISQGLDDDLASDSPPAPAIIFQRTLTLIESLLNVVDRHLDLASLLEQDPDSIQQFHQLRRQLGEQSDGLGSRFQRAIEGLEPLLIDELVMLASAVRGEVEALIADLDDFNGIASVAINQTLANIDRLLSDSGQTLASIGGGLVPVQLDFDDAMMTALVLRFDLMNERGLLADDWRQIKLAGDELRSVLNLNASQRISTRADVNRPFDFTWDESNTALQLTFDAPLNRRAQRNNYRTALINYQVGLRSLIQLEDTIKRAVRNDLRSLSLDREQYRIDVASAALAFERVVSTRLEFRLGTGGVAARDFLEAQTAYANALSNVAARHIGYIVDRTQLFLDLELLTVGDDGFWPELYNEEFQPESYYQLPPWAAPYYGDLPPVWYSKDIHRMLHVPPGNAMMHGTSDLQDTPAIAPAEGGLEPLPPAPLPVDY